MNGCVSVCRSVGVSECRVSSVECRVPSVECRSAKTKRTIRIQIGYWCLRVVGWGSKKRGMRPDKNRGGSSDDWIERRCRLGSTFGLGDGRGRESWYRPKGSYYVGMDAYLGTSQQLQTVQVGKRWASCQQQGESRCYPARPACTCFSSPEQGLPTYISTCPDEYLRR